MITHQSLFLLFDLNIQMEDTLTKLTCYLCDCPVSAYHISCPNSHYACSHCAKNCYMDDGLKIYSCGVCRNENITELYQPVFIELYKLLNITRKCHYADYGCPKTSADPDFDKHIYTCTFRGHTCEYQYCGCLIPNESGAIANHYSDHHDFDIIDTLNFNLSYKNSRLFYKSWIVPISEFNVLFIHLNHTTINCYSLLRPIENIKINVGNKEIDLIADNYYDISVLIKDLEIVDDLIKISVNNIKYKHVDHEKKYDDFNEYGSPPPESDEEEAEEEEAEEEVEEENINAEQDNVNNQENVGELGVNIIDRPLPSMTYVISLLKSSETLITNTKYINPNHIIDTVYEAFKDFVDTGTCEHIISETTNWFQGDMQNLSLNVVVDDICIAIILSDLTK